MAELARQEQLDALAEHMRALRPWTGEAGALRDLSVPDADDIERWKNSTAETERRIEGREDEIERLLADQRRRTAEIEAAGQVAGVLSDQQAADVRAAREEAWASHKRTLDAARRP
jgi:cytochrome c553